MRTLATPLLLASVLAIFALPTPTQATVCWVLEPLNDKIEAAFEVSEGYGQVFGRWVVTDFVGMPIIGSALRIDPETIRLGIHLINSTPEYGGYRDCVLDATLDSALKGPFTLSCGGDQFVAEGTMVEGFCPD